MLFLLHQIFFKKFIAKRYRAKGTTIIASEGDVEMQENSTPEVQYDDPQVAEFEKQRAGTCACVCVRVRVRVRVRM